MSSLIRRIRRLFTPGWQIYRPVVAADRYNEQVKTWPDAPESTVDGFLWQLKAGEQFMGSKHTYVGTHAFVCDPDVDVQLGDEIRKGTRRYSVVAVDDVAEQGKLKQVGLEWQQ